MNLVEVQNLRKSYGEIEVLKNLNFTIKAGEIFSLLGRNGAGKTTTLDILEGLQNDYSGDVYLFGKDIATHALYIRRRIGVQLQSTTLISDMATYISVIDQVKMFASLYQLQLSNKEALRFLERFRLDDKAKANPAKLSGGEKQRLVLALALVNDPEIVILDEPTAGLDVQSRKMLWDVIEEWRSDKRAIILTTHYIEEAEKLADRVAVLHDGQIAALDTPQALVNSLDVESCIIVDGHLMKEFTDSLSTVKRVTNTGRTTKLYTLDINQTHIELVTQASQFNVKLNNMHIKHPTLEDVVLSVTGDSMRPDIEI